MTRLTDDLTEFEVTVLRKLGRGQTIKEIAIDSGVTQNSMSCYADRIRTKLGAKTNVQAVVMALTAGIIE